MRAALLGVMCLAFAGCRTVVEAPPEPVGVVCDASGNCTLAGG